MDGARAYWIAAGLGLAATAGCDNGVPARDDPAGDAAAPAVPDAAGADASPEVEGIAIALNPSVQAEEPSTGAGHGDVFGFGHWWSLHEDETASGGLYARSAAAGEQCTIDDGCDILLNAPRLSYELRTRDAGQHFVWLRVRSGEVDRNSVHLGIDGTVRQTQWDFAGLADSWEWHRSDPVTLDQAGVVTVDVFMAEGGTLLDQLLVTADENLTPSPEHRAPPLIWEAEDGAATSPDSSAWMVANDEQAFAGKSMVLGPSGADCECAWTDLDNDTVADYDECTGCDVANTSAALTFNKLFENPNYQEPDRIWLRAQFSGTARLHVGIRGSVYGETLHSDIELEGGTGSWEWYSFDLPAENAGQVVHSTQVQFFGGTAGLAVDQIIMTIDQSFVPSSGE